MIRKNPGPINKLIDYIDWIRLKSGKLNKFGRLDQIAWILHNCRQHPCFCCAGEVNVGHEFDRLLTTVCDSPRTKTSPNPPKCFEFRVASCAPCARQIAAICASAIPTSRPLALLPARRSAQPLPLPDQMAECARRNRVPAWQTFANCRLRAPDGKRAMPNISADATTLFNLAFKTKMTPSPGNTCASSYLIHSNLRTKERCRFPPG